MAELPHQEILPRREAPDRLELDPRRQHDAQRPPPSETPSAPISGSEEFVFTETRGSVKHPLTGEDVAPKPLIGKAPIEEGEDPRAAFVRWMASTENPYFAQVAVNRIWTEVMGRGIVEPVDDIRATKTC